MVHHVLVLTDDLEASRAFYVDALGFVVADRPPLEFSGIWLRLEEDADASIHLADRGGVPRAHRDARPGAGRGRARPRGSWA